MCQHVSIRRSLVAVRMAVPRASLRHHVCWSAGARGRSLCTFWLRRCRACRLDKHMTHMALSPSACRGLQQCHWCIRR
jgi:hypothetical protein